MGYIAPVNQEQYVQYVNRLMKTQSNDIQIQPVKKISLNEQNQHLLDRSKRELKRGDKGKYINELI